MSRRFTTRLSEPVLRLLLTKAAEEKKSMSETIEGVLSNALLLNNEKDEINSLARSVQELSLSLASLKKDFQIHKDSSEREFQMILNLLVLANEIAKQVLSKGEYEKTWNQYQRKHDEYKTTGRISL